MNADVPSLVPSLVTTSNRTKLFIPSAFFIAMLGLLWFGLGRDPGHLPSALVDRPLPTFNRPDLFDETSNITSEQIRGGIFLINVWGTYCAPCHAEHPYFLEISAREPNVTFVGVNYKDDVKAAREFLDERGNPFKLNLIDLDGSLGIDLGVAGPPETFVVDKTGTIRYRYVGVIDHKVWAEIFVPLIAQIQ
jgi:cytochrome c biogenesis protein CcmG/thiol:disulfide interchange protein DsbE